MRMSMRRFTRLTNAFFKKVENHAHAVALRFMNYFIELAAARRYRGWRDESPMVAGGHCKNR